MKTLLLGAAVLAFAACGSESPDDPNTPDDPSNPDDPDDPNDPEDPDETARDYDDLANVLGTSAVAGELSAMVDMVVISHGGTPSGFAVSQQGHYTIAEGARGGVTFTYQYHCNDDADVILPSCSPSVNHSHIIPLMSGDMTGANMSMTSIVHDGNIAVRDINAGKPRVGGKGEMGFVAQLSDASFDLTYTSNFDRVRFDPNGVLPLSGKLDLTIAVQRDRGGATRSFGVVAALAFDGDNTATLTLDATRSYDIDLTTGVATKL